MSDPENFHHNVYVILLDDAVLQHPSILRLNRKRDPAKPCVYVGMTGLPVEHRFENHKHGYKSAWVVEKYGSAYFRNFIRISTRCRSRPPCRWKWSWRKTCARKATPSPAGNSRAIRLTSLSLLLEDVAVIETPDAESIDERGDAEQDAQGRE